MCYKKDDGSYSCDADNGADDGNLFKSFMRGWWVWVQDTAYPQTDEERDEVVQRAETYVGKKGYSLIFNKCEHLITRIMTGRPQCKQFIKKTGECCEQYWKKTNEMCGSG